MDEERMKNLAEATGLVVGSKLVAEFISSKLGNPFIGAAIVGAAGLFVVKGQRGNYVFAGAVVDVVEDFVRGFLKI